MLAVCSFPTTLRDSNCELLDNPVYAEVAILENSKIPMYDFYCNTLKKPYGAKCEFVYKATDILLLEIQTDNIYKDMGDNYQ